MARKVTYEDLERLQEGQFALAAKVNERQGSLTKIETILELVLQTFQSQNQIQVHELGEMKDQIQQDVQQIASDMKHKVEEEQVQQFASNLVHNHEQLQMEVVQTINKEIASVVTNTCCRRDQFQEWFFSYFTKAEQVFFCSKGFTRFQHFHQQNVLHPCASY